MNTEILITNILHKIYSMYKILIYNPKIDFIENFTLHDDSNMCEIDWTIGSAPEGYIYQRAWVEDIGRFKIGHLTAHIINTLLILLP